MNYENKADFFHMLAHPVRLQILNELRREAACVCHLQAVTGRPQAYVSQQLRLLRESGLVRDEKEGQMVYYHLLDDRVRLALAIVLGESGPPSRPADCTCPVCSAQSA